MGGRLTPLGDQKELASRMDSHSGRPPDFFGAGTRPGPVRPGTTAEAAAGMAAAPISRPASISRRELLPSAFIVRPEAAEARSGETGATKAEQLATRAKRTATTCRGRHP
tara:strand:- start:2145 stop:2474 length:330 start_codon:yes stop_codon:yes gene_type:complete